MIKGVQKDNDDAGAACVFVAYFSAEPHIICPVCERGRAMRVCVCVACECEVPTATTTYSSG